MRFWQNLMTEAGAIPLQELRPGLEMPDSRYLSLQGMQVHYRDVGDPQAPVLILLHGIFSSLHTWNDWTAILSQDFRVISLDSPNFGLTGPHPEGMKRHLYSDFLNAFTDALGIQQCYVAGNSLGGWMTWEFAARYPHKVLKAVLLDSAGYFFIPPSGLLFMGLPLGGWLTARVVPPSGAFNAMLRTTYADPGRLSDEVLNRYYRLWLRPGNRQAGARVLRFIRNRGGFNPRLIRQVKQPVLILWGKQDRWIPPAHTERFIQAMPQAEAILYDDCGHMPMEELPRESAADCRRFLLS
ncbi:MAG: alpha/beta hydrolase [Oceanospirillaceae bacterium]|nr:alpha/beta hydrolase [Oceanospirillaceae bacterium]MBT13954.1 alpha/beta hydrolase [Oceanospirillaceae bacterium]|tara:strand:- start:33629 stop:34519 length:891 start_codon:yes stop_codon:yes gene_type:complete